MPDLDEFLEDLSSAAPVPGGGSAAAVSAAMAASLLAMVGNLTVGRKRYAAVETDVRRIRDTAVALRRRAQALATEDADAYAQVAEAMRLPRASEDERRLRSERIQQALKQAAVPPLETMRVSAEILQLSRELVEVGNRSAVSDVGTAANLARAALSSAALNVEINAHSVRDESWAAETRAQESELQRVESVAHAVQERVALIMRGDA